jgi:hypothetical protein
VTIPKAPRIPECYKNWRIGWGGEYATRWGVDMTARNWDELRAMIDLRDEEEARTNWRAIYYCGGWP